MDKEERKQSDLVDVFVKENGEKIYQCRHCGTKLCQYIPESKTMDCYNCPIMKLLLEKVGFLEEIEKELV